MKLIALIAFPLLLSTSSSSSIKTDPNKKEIEYDGSEEVKTHITDLHDDIFYDIFTYLELHDVINVVTAIPSTSTIANELVQRNYPKLALHTATKTPSYYYVISQVYPKTILFVNFEYGLKALKQFGEYFQEVDNKYGRLSGPDRAIITETLNNCTAKTLKKLKINDANGIVFNHLTLPFEELQELECEFDYNLYNTNGYKPWSYLFPKLEQLTLDIGHVENTSFIDCEIPHLKHLTLNNMVIFPENTTVWRRFDFIKSFLQKNPQIKSIELSKSEITGFFKAIESLLPNLENLTLSEADINRDSACLKNVKYLELNKQNSNGFRNLSLPSLKSIYMEYPDVSSDWPDFFRRHNHVNHLILHHPYRPSVGLNNFFLNFPNLVDVTIISVDKRHSRNGGIFLGTQFITQFIERRENLRKFCCSNPSGRAEKAKADILLAQLPNEWIITEYREQLCLEKKNLM